MGPCTYTIGRIYSTCVQPYIINVLFLPFHVVLKNFALWLCEYCVALKEFQYRASLGLIFLVLYVMPSHFQLPTHYYSDKAVQTEQVLVPALCEKESSLLQKPSFAVSLCGVVETAAAGETAVSSESAYIPSKMPSPSSSTFLGKNKAWLGFNGPSSGFNVAQRRVVSVPDSSHVKTVVDRNIRVVSMPDSNGCKVSVLDDTDDYAVQVGSRLLGPEQYSDDLPQSPSPPSSPDSILVTGNESRIHGSIFRHDADENGTSSTDIDKTC